MEWSISTAVRIAVLYPRANPHHVNYLWLLLSCIWARAHIKLLQIMKCGAPQQIIYSICLWSILSVIVPCQKQFAFITFGETNLFIVNPHLWAEIGLKKWYLRVRYKWPQGDRFPGYVILIMEVITSPAGALEKPELIYGDKASRGAITTKKHDVAAICTSKSLAGN